VRLCDVASIQDGTGPSVARADGCRSNAKPGSRPELPHKYQSAARLELHPLHRTDAATDLPRYRDEHNSPVEELNDLFSFVRIDLQPSESSSSQQGSSPSRFSILRAAFPVIVLFP